MGKMSELALLLDEFREANRRANELAEEISAMLSGEEPHPHEKAKEVKIHVSNSSSIRFIASFIIYNVSYPYFIYTTQE